MAKVQITVRLDKDQLARAKKALGAETVTEAIRCALALVTEEVWAEGTPSAASVRSQAQVKGSSR